MLLLSFYVLLPDRFARIHRLFSKTFTRPSYVTLFSPNIVVKPVRQLNTGSTNAIVISLPREELVKKLLDPLRTSIAEKCF